MKELSIEEKAKRYDEALGKARRYYDEYKTRDNILYVEDMEDMFPELKESEDNRIRKWIIGILSTYEHDRDLRNAAIAYLEKQGEQNPAWSEENEEIYRKCICAMRTSACGFPEEEKFVEQVDNWLKYLKERVQPQNTWKPSDEQMDALGSAIVDSISSIQKHSLESLYNELKKLF